MFIWRYDFNIVTSPYLTPQSDFDVCPECGSLQWCLHDDTADPIPRSIIPDDADNFYEMVANLAIPPNSEVFNTYGETLSNAQLLVQYGFILDGNDNDHLTWTFNEVAQFSENYFSASAWTWDSIGGLLHFQDLLRSLNSFPWDHISESELVQLDHTHLFCLNGDATISHGLWLYFALLVCLRNTSNPPDHSRNSVVVLLEEILQCQLTLEQHIAIAASGEDMSVPQLPGDEQRPAPYVVILELARLLASFCCVRSARTGRAGVEMTELGDILDVRRSPCVSLLLRATLSLRRAFPLQRLPNDMTPTRMAISLALTERSLLDSCMSAWEDIADCLA